MYKELIGKYLWMGKSGRLSHGAPDCFRDKYSYVSVILIYLWQEVFTDQRNEWQTRACSFMCSFSFLFVLLSPIPSLFSQFSLRAVFVGTRKATAVKACIVPAQSSKEKTHIVIHINFQLFCVGSNGEVPFVWTSSRQYRGDKKRGC